MAETRASRPSVRDKVFMLDAPLQGDPVELATLGYRYGGTMWGADDLAMLTEFWWKTRQLRVWSVRPGDPDAEPQLLQERSYQDRYADPGDPVTEPNEFGPGRDPHRGRGSIDLPDRRRRLARGRSPVHRPLRHRDGRDDAALPLRGAVLRGPDRRTGRRRPPGAHPARVGGRPAQLLRARPGERRADAGYLLPAPHAAAHRHSEGADPSTSARTAWR